MMISKIEPTTEERVVKTIRTASFKVLSIVSISLLNRFIILPSGVVSKKDIGAAMIPSIASK